MKIVGLTETEKHHILNGAFGLVLNKERADGRPGFWVMLKDGASVELYEENIEH